LITADADLRVCDDVTLAYGDDPVVSGLSATIPAGRITVINGPSGAGKTTVLNALLGFLTPREGEVLIGAQDLVDIDVRQWWEHVAWVPQSPQLLPTTLRENLTLGRTWMSPRYWRRPGSRTGCAGLPDGLDTVVGEGGRPVSVGQARRIALAGPCCDEPACSCSTSPRPASTRSPRPRSSTCCAGRCDR
jgi:ATP-binding cassette subfamily C protein CydD